MTLGPATSARRRRVARAAAGVLAGAALVGAVAAPGFDEREAEPVDTAVWALQTGAGQRFARVNTEIAEVDTVKEVDDPSALLHHGDTLLVLSASLTAVTPLDAARPTDVDSSTPGTVATPEGTRVVVQDGDTVAYLTADGDVFAGRMSDGGALAPREVTLPDGTGLRALAVAVTADGAVAAYSPAAGGMALARLGVADVSVADVPGASQQGSFQVSFAGDSWLLLDVDTGRLWREGVDDAVATGTDADARLQRPSGSDTVRIADGRGLVEVRPGATPERVVGATAIVGAPAAPAELEGVVYAAWLPAGQGQGTLWSSVAPVAPLSYGDESLPERRQVTLRSNGSRMVLNETRSGWVWDIPTGELVRSSQDWSPRDQTTADADREDVAAQVREPRAPVAVDDALGVRPGRQVRLPVLLNDHDANRDVLTVDPGSLTQPGGGFGVVGIADDGQALVVDVDASATGSATFTYAVTDGTAADGLRSEPATVTLTVASGDSAPEWCGVADCVAEWPEPQVAPGGTVALEVLDAWVDPEGDPVFLMGASTSTPGVAVVASPQGRVTVRHAGDDATVTVDVMVADVTGAVAERELTVRVVGTPDLAIEPVAVTALAGVRTSVDVAARVSGATGPVTVTEASVDPDEGAQVAPSPDGAGVQFAASAPGDYLVDVTAVDGASQARGHVRVTVVAPEDESLATVPLTAFVRPQEDVTVDVLGAVTNPGGRVLLISEAAVDPAAAARLSASIVGHGALRLSGTTGDGEPGVMGVVSYTVSDGSGRDAMTVRGEITVVLLDAAVPAPPLASDDAVTVRVGGQVDVRVLDNDVAAAGAVVALDAGSVTAPEGGGLAFPAGPVIRVLAPNVAGTYRIPYAAYVLGFPSQRDGAALVVTVTDGDDNAAPASIDLAGRASSGEDVRLVLVGSALDPDGDPVRLDAVVSQPTHGAARLSADGTALVYRSTPGYAGQDAFDFQVVDARGRSAEATARIGVVGSDADPAPVTYTDFVQVQAGAGRKVVVSPLANDLDLTGGALELLEVRPDAPAGSPEYDSLAALAPASLNGADALADGRVTFRVTADVGTFAFLYSVRNTTGSIAQGRIVLKAVREDVVDVPVVADTVLTFETRASFVTGVDVLDGTVAWASGDPTGLRLSLWDEQPDLAVDGARISGPLPELTRIVPFEVAGEDFAGETSIGYGFLRVPGTRDVRLALREDALLSVDEGGEATVDVAALVAAPPGTAFEVDAGQVRAGGARAAADCAGAGGTAIRYEAGPGAPFTDTCLVPIRVPGQSAWTLLPVPVAVVPADPVPTLVSASLEIPPGDTATFDLSRMVRWPAGATPRDEDLASAYGGQMFEVVRAGTVVTLRARDDALPGRAESLTVSLRDHPEVRPRVLSLVVGPAPSELPKGGALVAECSQADGSDCALAVVGAPGEVNPLPTTALEVVEVTSAGDCPGVTFEVADSATVLASWTAEAAGGVCDALFAVRDAQGRVSGAARLGSISLDLQGFPRAPGAAAQVAYGDGTLTLAVQPGPAANAYPAITGFDVLAAGARVGTCDAAGACEPLVVVANGEQTVYSVHAVNPVGRSRDATRVTAWAYAPPAAPTLVSWVPTVTSGDGRRIDLTVDITDPSTRELRVTASGVSQDVPVRDGEQRLDAIAIGSNSPVDVVLTPLTALPLPPVEGAAPGGEAVTFTANGVGRPTIASATHAYTEGDSTATVTAMISSGGAGSTAWAGWSAGGACRPGTAVTDGAVTFTVPVAANTTNTITVCAESRLGLEVYGTAEPATVTFAAFTDPGPPEQVRGYRVAATCEGDGTSCAVALEREASFRPQPGLTLRYRASDGVTSGSFADVLAPGRAVSVVAFWCAEFGGGQRSCSDQVTAVTPEAGAAYRPTVTFASCTVGAAPAPVVGGDAADVAAVVTMLDADGAPTADPAQMRSARVAVTFQGPLTGIAPWTSADVVCGGASPSPSPSGGAP